MDFSGIDFIKEVTVTNEDDFIMKTTTSVIDILIHAFKFRKYIENISGKKISNFTSAT